MMKTFKNLKSYKHLKALKEKEHNLKLEIIQVKDQSSDLKNELADLSHQYQVELNNEHSDYEKAKQIRGEIDEIHEKLSEVSKTTSHLKNQLNELQEKEVKPAEKGFIREAAPLVDQALGQMLPLAKQINEINETFFEMKREHDKVKKDGNTRYSKEDVLANLPGINLKTERVLEIVNYQKKQWESFKAAVK